MSSRNLRGQGSKDEKGSNSRDAK